MSRVGVDVTVSEQTKETPHSVVHLHKGSRDSKSRENIAYKPQCGSTYSCFSRSWKHPKGSTLTVTPACEHTDTMKYTHASGLHSWGPTSLLRRWLLKGSSALT